VQLLPDGHYFVGWGAHAYFTEFDRSGRVLLDGRFGNGADSYRAYRFRWTGHPVGRPAVVLRRSHGNRTTVFVSWNGATEVRRWQVLAGPEPRALRPIRTAAKAGFETAVVVRTDARYLAVRALAAGGTVLGSSDVVPAQPRTSRSGA
jgi:hypothetical protein